MYSKFYLCFFTTESFLNLLTSCFMKKNLINSNLLMTLIVFYCFGCTSMPNTKQQNSEIYKIDIEESFNDKRVFPLSEIADTIKYIRLITPPGIIISSARKFVVENNFIILKSKGVIHQFNIKGEYVRQIGKKGKGPGEYVSAGDFFIDTCKREIAISHYPQISYYKYNGDFVRKIKVPAPEITYIDDILWTAKDALGLYKHRLVGLNQNLDTIATIPNYTFYNLNRGQVVGQKSKIASSFYTYKGCAFFKGTEYNDTVWRINSTNQVPHLIMGMGKLKLPRKLNPSYSMRNFEKRGGAYLGVPRLSEDDNYIFLTGRQCLSDALYTHCVLYDKTKRSSFLISSGGNPGINDNILNGPPFWPYNINDQYYIGCIEAFELLDYYNANQTNTHKNLKKVISNINKYSNQLIILCKKRKIQ